MEALKNKTIDFAKDHKKALLAEGGGIALASSLRLYFRGGVCKAVRDLSGQVVVITGGNSGIGRETVMELASKGCTIIIGARDEAKSEEVVKRVREKHPNCQIMHYKLDLGEKKSIEEFV